jgi:hypothetical protein
MKNFFSRLFGRKEEKKPAQQYTAAQAEEYKLYSVPQVAALLGLHKSTIWQFIRDGRLKTVDVTIKPADQRQRTRIKISHVDLAWFVADRKRPLPAQNLFITSKRK